MNSVSYTSIAIHITNYFFLKNSYLHYDKFLICAASIVLAHKCKDSSFKLKSLIQQFHKLLAKMENRTSVVLNSDLIEKYKYDI